jgi:hypothetical protein
VGAVPCWPGLVILAVAGAAGAAAPDARAMLVAVFTLAGFALLALAEPRPSA